jgi:hypothetical protein
MRLFSTGLPALESDKKRKLIQLLESYHLGVLCVLAQEPFAMIGHYKRIILTMNLTEFTQELPGDMPTIDCEKASLSVRSIFGDVYNELLVVPEIDTGARLCLETFLQHVEEMLWPYCNLLLPF